MATYNKVAEIALKLRLYVTVVMVYWYMLGKGGGVSIGRWLGGGVSIGRWVGGGGGGWVGMVVVVVVGWGGGVGGGWGGGGWL